MNDPTRWSPLWVLVTNLLSTHPAEHVLAVSDTPDTFGSACLSVLSAVEQCGMLVSVVMSKTQGKVQVLTTTVLGYCYRTWAWLQGKICTSNGFPERAVGVTILDVAAFKQYRPPGTGSKGILTSMIQHYWQLICSFTYTR